MGNIERDQDDCTCDPPENPTPLGAALCSLHGWDALRRQVVRLSLQHQGAVEAARAVLDSAEPCAVGNHHVLTDRLDALARACGLPTTRGGQ